MYSFEQIKTENVLQEAVLEILKSETSEEELEDYISGILNHGCISGWCSSLCYYNQTLAFYSKYTQYINDMVKDLLWELGMDCMKSIFGDKFDSEDPLCLETTNQNLLTWFSFEETVRQFSDQLGMEV